MTEREGVQQKLAEITDNEQKEYAEILKSLSDGLKKKLKYNNKHLLTESEKAEFDNMLDRLQRLYCE